MRNQLLFDLLKFVLLLSHFLFVRCFIPQKECFPVSKVFILQRLLLLRTQNNQRAVSECMKNRMAWYYYINILSSVFFYSPFHFFFFLTWLWRNPLYWFIYDIWLCFQDHVGSNHSAKRESANREVSGAGKKDIGKSTKKAGTLSFYLLLYYFCCTEIILYIFIFTLFHIDKGKTAKEEARELLLNEEASIREKVQGVQRNLSLMLSALGEMAIANPVFAHSQLPSLVCVWQQILYMCTCSSVSDF